MEALELLWESRCAGCKAARTGALCPPCRVHLSLRWAPHRVVGARGAVAVAAYRTPIGTALRKAKYGGDRSAMSILARVLGPAADPWLAGGPFDVVVPAPSPWTRRIARGYSPASVLGAAVARHTGLPLVHALTLSVGRRNAGLSATGRRNNLTGRLRARRDVPGRVLLVDDVITTGATASACARELLGGTTHSVWVLCLCATGGV